MEIARHRALLSILGNPRVSITILVSSHVLLYFTSDSYEIEGSLSIQKRNLLLKNILVCVKRTGIRRPINELQIRLSDRKHLVLKHFR